MNSVNLIGRMTRDPELRRTPNGKAVCSFTLAVPRPWSRGKTDFIACVAWEKQAELICTYLHKGDQVGASGQINIDTYEINIYEKDGEKRKRVEVLCERIDLLGGKKETSQAAAPNFMEPVDDMSDDDLPF